MKNLRGSSYTIDIELPGDEILLIHGYTGAVYTVPGKIARYINQSADPVQKGRSYPETPSDEIINKLRQGGFLTDLNPEEEKSFVSRINNNMHKGKLQSRPDYMIIPTYDCNFNCYYCYENDMRKKRGDEYITKIISSETVDQIAYAMDEIEELVACKKTERSRHITFYGGEPLQRKTKDAVSYIINKFKDKGKEDFTFSAISNGYEIEHFEDLLGPGKISEIQITLDGIPEVHNKSRVLKNGGDGTFGKISENIGLALGKGVKTNVRVNIDKETVLMFEDLAELFERKGWNNYNNFNASLAPVFRSSREPGKDKCFDYGQLFNALKKYRENLPSHTMRNITVSQEDYFDSMDKLIEDKESLVPHFRSSICNSMTTMFIFDPHGEIYPCFETVGRPESVIGIVQAGNLSLNNETYGKWRNRIAASNPECGTCSYVLFCGGGCASRAEDRNGTIYSKYCDGFPLFFRSKIREMFMRRIESAGAAVVAG